MNDDDTTDTPHREDASDLQRWIDGLLRSSDAAELEAAPATTHFAATSAMKTFRSRRIRRHSLSVFAAAAAIVGVLAIWPTVLLPRREGTGKGLAIPLVVHAPEAPATVENPSPSPSLQGRGIGESLARFESNGETIAIPLASDDPQVSIVKLYPTTTTERRWHRESTLYARHSGQDGG
jgi:hypothetical protein